MTARGCLFIVLLLASGELLPAAQKAVQFHTIRDALVYRPPMQYYRSWDIEGTCTVDMVVDPKTGHVTNVFLVESSGNKYLNGLANESLRKWRFRPGSPGLIRTSFDLTSGSYRGHLAPERHGMRMDDVLAPFLGHGTLLRGELPAYPTSPAWTNKHGTGVFVLHVDRTGRVSQVAIKTSSGDALFDRVTDHALSQWRFSRGPLEIELPLTFVLTPEKFAVNIPRHH